jgi:hypothetical protein
VLPTVGFWGVSAYLPAIGSQQMAFQSGHRRGQVWEDVKMLDTIIKNSRFNLTGKSERDFELLFSERVRANSDRINGKIISQVDKETVVRSVYCFGKKHRPDLTINEDGTAVEIKYLNGSLDGLKQAIGQSIFYRVRYRFVINLFVVDEKHKDVYVKAANDEEKDLEEILRDLSTDMNIFSYIVPAFSAAPNLKACLEWNDIHDA